jgi:uncharacterized protein with FMN-binding domain
MAARMSNKLIALCSAALGAVYVAGYLVTLPPGAQAASTPFTTAAATPLTGQSVAVGNHPSTAPAPPPSKYKDGTYSGTGTNRIGSVTVAVTIKSDKIVDVQITDCTTHYREDLITGLPAEALQIQSANVHLVSGATKSTLDFRTGMEQALADAQSQAQTHS